MTLDEAIRASDVKMDEVFHTVEHDGHAILFYGEGDSLSVGLVEKTPLGYRWSFGAGSDHFDREDDRVTWAGANLHPRKQRSDEGRWK